MAEPWPFVRVLIILMMCFLLSHRSSPAVVAPTPPAGTLCLLREREALLDFKAGLNDPDNILSSWRGADCCRWKGVVCSSRTGHVVELRINSTDDNSYDFGIIGGEIRSSLLTLRHLKQLDLSYNDFSLQPIPELIGALRSLTHLDLSYSNFGGRIPPHIGNLSNLLSLQLNIDTEIQDMLNSHDLAWVSRLRKLRVLSMSGVDLSAAVDWFQAVNMLPGLIHLDLGFCGLQNTMPPPLHSNLTSLESLDLQYNPFNTSLVAKNLGLLWNLPSLQVLSLSGCGIHGPIPDVVGNLTSLQNLYLESNHFTGMVPLTFRKLKKLQCLELTDNFINMDVKKLLHLLPSNGLQMLHLRCNSLTGSLPDWIGRFSSLNRLYLDYNKLSGEIPVGIRELRNLRVLALSSNNLHGTVTEEHFTNLTTLRYLWISDNSLTVKVNSTWYTPFRLVSAGFSSCILGPQFPAWLIKPTMQELDISNASIHDNIPAEFWTGSSYLSLDLSRNRLVGMLPTLGDLELKTLVISSNELTGPIPTLPKMLRYMDLSRNNLSGPLPSGNEVPMLEVLLLFNNSLSGTIPCSLLQLQQLVSLDLSNNLLHGTIPKCPQGYITSLIATLNLNNNNLSGPFPMFLQRCRELILLDLAYNNFSGSLPSWIGSRLPQLALLRLRSNMFSGGMPSQLSRMKWLQYLDIACNNISGNIPESFGNLIAMTLAPNDSGALFNLFGIGSVTSNFFSSYYYTESLLVDTKGQQLEYTSGIRYMVNIDLSCNRLIGQIPSEIGMLVALKNLNLSWNSVSGIMPQSIGELRALESFDMSHNELSGEIPASLSALTSLSRLNLSYNNLTGTIPSGNQLRTLDDQASIYIGNPGLCGPPLMKSCSGTDKSTLVPEEHEGMSGMVSFYLSSCLGFVVGLWIVFCGFLFKRKWRIACFSFSDHIYDCVYVEVSVGWASLARKIRQG